MAIQSTKHHASKDKVWVKVLQPIPRGMQPGWIGLMPRALAYSLEQAGKLEILESTAPAPQLQPQRAPASNTTLVNGKLVTTTPGGFTRVRKF